MIPHRNQTQAPTSRSILWSLMFVALTPFVSYAQTKGQLLVGSSNQVIWRVNPDTGAATSLYASDSGDATAWGMAYDSDSSTLYWNSGSTLFSSYYTPQSTTLNPTNVGDILLLGDNFSVDGLAFVNGKLFATSRGNSGLYEINLSTLEASFVQQYIDPSNVGGIGFDVLGDGLYGADNAKASLLEFEVSAQLELPVVNLPTTLQDASFEGVAAFDDRVFVVANRGGDSGQPGIYVLDLQSGSVVNTFPSPFSFTPQYVSATFVPADTDTDGIPDYLDNCPDLSNSLQEDSDGDGVGDACDLCSSDSSKSQDVDSDSDGILDCNELCPNDPNKTIPGVCGCGSLEEDLDSDGVPVCFDTCPSDPMKSSPGICGCGVSDQDLNANGIPDCLPQAEFVGTFERILDLLKLLKKALKSFTREVLSPSEVKRQIKSALNDLSDLKASSLNSTKSEKKTNKLIKRTKKKIKGALKLKKRDARRRNKRAIRAVRRLLKVVG